MTPQEFLEIEKETVVEFFNKFHEVVPQFVILRSTDKIEHYLVEQGIQSDRQRDASYDSMKKICKQPNVICAVQIMDVWCSMGEGTISTKIRPSEDPNRQSAVIIVFYSKSEQRAFVYLDKNGKLELSINGDGELKTKFGNPFSIINLKNKKYN